MTLPSTPGTYIELKIQDNRLTTGDEYTVAVFENDAYTKRKRLETRGTVDGDGRVHLDELQGGYALATFTADAEDGEKASAYFVDSEFQAVEALNGWVDGVKYKAGSDYALVDADGFLYGKESFVGRNYETVVVEEPPAPPAPPEPGCDYSWGIPDTVHVRAFAESQDQLDGIVSFNYVDPAGINRIWDTDQVDSLTGTGGSDWLGGGVGNDFIRGRNGNDFILGDNGNDNLRGNKGKDILVGGTGNDELGGGADNDLLFGGAGADVFRLSAGCDVIADFEAGVDSFHIGTVTGLQGVNTADGALLTYDTHYGNGAGSALVVGADLSELGITF